MQAKQVVALKRLSVLLKNGRYLVESL